MEAQFSGIESSVNDDSKAEAQLEVLARKHKQDKKAKIMRQEARSKARKKQKLMQARETKKQKKLESVLAKEEARVRMTTAKKVKAQLNFERAEDVKRARLAKLDQAKHPLSRLTPQQETREEYQRMYLANTEQQMEQAKTNLKNHLADIKGDDARRMKLLSGDIMKKKESLLGDIQSLHKLSNEYQRDHELGESLEAKNGAGGLANAEKSVEQKDIAAESHIATAAQAEMNKLQNDPHAHAMDSLVQAAHQALRTSSIYNNRDLGDSNTPVPALTLQQVKLAAKLASVKETLHLKLSALKEQRKLARPLLSQATAVRTGALAARTQEQQAQASTSAMRNVASTLNGDITKHETDMELSESLFREEETSDLGESSSTKQALPPVQAELNWEAKQLADAQAQLVRIRKDGPSIIHEQTMSDKRMLGKALRLANSKLMTVKKRFVTTAQELSPKIKSQHQLDEAVDDEQERQQELARDLHSISDDASQVTNFEKAASNSAQGIV